MMRNALVTLCLVVSATAIPAVDFVDNDEYVSTPAGYMLRRCVHELPDGATVRTETTGDRTVLDAQGKYLKTLPACNATADKPMFRDLPTDYDGWTAYTAYQTPDAAGFDAFLGYFSVPDLPKSTPQVLYLFTGLQNIDWIPKVDPMPKTAFDIIQPVLQYPCGFLDKHWCVKSWYVTVDSGASYSTAKKVNPGDAIFGNMTRVGPTSWFISSVINSTGEATSITADHPRLKTQPWAYNTLECYGCSGCNTYPTQPSVFSELQLTQNGKPVEAKWEVNPKPSQSTQCHEGATVKSSSLVDLYFDGAAQK
mmetsp:Transcript_2356/g.4864  ORF Transcript_2356/g.4864 Transcript_2356/m.4864 type:complete len:309 (-) Transcript_2356:35-961(-)